MASNVNRRRPVARVFNPCARRTNHGDRTLASMGRSRHGLKTRVTIAPFGAGWDGSSAGWDPSKLLDEMPGEFEFIEWLRAQPGPAKDAVPVPPGDDLAVLRWAGDDLLLVGADQVLDG